MYTGNNVNNNNVKELPVYDFRKKSRTSSLASQSLPWFYRKSKRVSIRNDDGKPLGLKVNFIRFFLISILLKVVFLLVYYCYY